MLWPRRPFSALTCFDEGFTDTLESDGASVDVLYF